MWCCATEVEIYCERHNSSIRESRWKRTNLWNRMYFSGHRSIVIARATIVTSLVLRLLSQKKILLLDGIPGVFLCKNPTKFILGSAAKWKQVVVAFSTKLFIGNNFFTFPTIKHVRKTFSELSKTPLSDKSKRCQKNTGFRSATMLLMARDTSLLCAAAVIILFRNRNVSEHFLPFLLVFAILISLKTSSNLRMNRLVGRNAIFHYSRSS